jgi:hypothetical protein
MNLTIFKVSRTSMFLPVSNIYIIPFVSHNKFSTNFLIVIRDVGTSIWLYLIANIILF